MKAAIICLALLSLTLSLWKGWDIWNVIRSLP